MSGVIDADGTQWEHCVHCRAFININELLYESPSEQFKYGRDLCWKCAKQKVAPITHQGPAITLHLNKDGGVDSITKHLKD